MNERLSCSQARVSLGLLLCQTHDYVKDLSTWAGEHTKTAAVKHFLANDCILFFIFYTQGCLLRSGNSD